MRYVATIWTSRASWILIVLAHAACSDGMPTQPPPSPISLTRAVVDPLVAGTGLSARLLLSVDGVEGDIVRVGLSTGTHLLRNGAPVSEVTLRDDGTQGDDVAGDRVFTVDGLTAPLDGHPVGSTTIGTVTLVGADGEGVVARPRISVRTVDAGQMTIPDITLLTDENLQFTSRIVVLVTQVDMSDFESARDRIVGRYYKIFPDDRDWLVLTRAPRATEEFEGQALRLRNAVRGIGIRVHTSFSIFGSASRLEFAVELVRDFYWPKGEFDGAFCLLTHELMHRWAAELSELTANSHWTNAFIRDASAFGWEGRCRFNPLELYLAGRLPPDSVAANLTEDGLRIDDIVSQHGPRTPSVDRSRYTIGFVVITDRFLSEDEVAYFHYLAEEYTKPESVLGLTFEGASGGRIALDGELLPIRVP